MKVKHLPFVAQDHLLKRLLSAPPELCYLGGDGSGWVPTVTWRPVDTFSYRQGKGLNMAKLMEFIATQKKRSFKVIGYFSYDIGHEFYGVANKHEDDISLPDVYLMAFSNYAEFHEDFVEVHYEDRSFLRQLSELLSTEENKPVSNKSIVFDTSLTKEAYAASFDKAKQYIHDGDVYQINLTHRLQAKTSDPARSIFSTIASANSVGYQAYIEAAGFELMSVSPECFIKITGQVIETFPVKGTKPRALNTKEDQRNRSALVESTKELAELTMITDLLRNDLGKVSQVGSVEVVGARRITPHKSVWHASSHVRARLLDGVSPIEALLSMLPGGSITGCPKKRAMEIINELEPVSRGVYTGTIVVIDPNGDIQSSIIIRTLIKQDENVYLQVGGGIVNDSVLDDEYQETFHKARAITSVL